MTLIQGAGDFDPLPDRQISPPTTDIFGSKTAMAGKPFTPFAAKVTQSVFGALRQQLFVAGNEVKVAAQISITKGSASMKRHVPSKPGEPPNNDTGVLADTIVVAPIEEGKSEVQVIAPAPYAPHLEFGTSKMAARPFMRPALAEAEPKIRQKMGEAVAAGIKKATK